MNGTYYPYTMPSANISQNLENYFCLFAAWKKEYLTESVYLNLVLSVIINSVTLPLTILFNGLLVFIIFFKRNLRKRMSNLAIGYLAITDIAVAVFVQPMFLATELCRISGQCNVCILDHIVFFVTTVLCRSSLNHLIVIAWDRFVAVKYALTYEVIVTKRKVLCGVLTAWLVSLILEGIFLLELYSFVTAFVSCFHFAFSFSLIAYFYTVIYLESKRHLRQIKATIPQCQIAKTNLVKQELKMAKTVAIMILCLLTCYATCVGVALGKTIFAPVTVSNISSWTIVSTWKYTLIFLNSLIKPLICGWRVKDLKEAGKVTFLPQKNHVKPRTETNIVRQLDEEGKSHHEGNINAQGIDNESPAIGGGSVRNYAFEIELTTHKSFSSSMNISETSHIPRRHSLPLLRTPNPDIEYHRCSTTDSKLIERRKSQTDRNEIKVTAMLRLKPVHLQNDLDFVLPGESTRNSLSQQL